MRNPSSSTALVTETTGAAGRRLLTLQWLDTSDLDGVEPFGFADGISQPQIDWSQEREMLAPSGRLQQRRLRLANSCSGYKNEYGKYTDRPLVEAGAASAGLLPAEDAPEKRDLGRERNLPRDASTATRMWRGFWQFLSEQTRWRSRTKQKSLQLPWSAARGPAILWCPSSRSRYPGIGPDPDEIRQNQFTYDADPAGVRCPFGAHVRRANPRNTDFPGKPRWPSASSSRCWALAPRAFGTI